MNHELKSPRGSSLKKTSANSTQISSNLDKILLKIYEDQENMEPNIPLDYKFTHVNYNLPKYGFLNEEYCCQICLQLITNESITVSCQTGCGSSLHKLCVELWNEDCKKTSDIVSCPLCRSVDPLCKNFDLIVDNIKDGGFSNEADFDCFNVFGAILVSELENYDWTQKISMSLLVDKVKSDLGSLLNDRKSMSSKVTSFKQRRSWSTSISDVARLCQIFATCVNGSVSLFIYNLRIADDAQSKNKIFNRLLIPIIRTIKLKCMPKNSEFEQICQMINEESRSKSSIAKLEKKFSAMSITKTINKKSKFLLTRSSSFRTIDGPPKLKRW